MNLHERSGYNSYMKELMNPPTKTFELQTKAARASVGQDEQHRGYDYKFFLRFRWTETCIHELHAKMEKFPRNWKVNIKMECVKSISIFVNT